MKRGSWWWLVCLGAAASVADACTLRVAQLERPAATHTHQTAAAQGLEGDLLHELAKRSACQITWRWVSLRGAWVAMEKGEIDVLPGALITPERARHALLVPLLAVPTVLLVPEGPGAARTPAQLAALPQARVLRLRGGAYAPAVQAWLDELAAQGRVDEVGDYKLGLRLLRAGRAQGFPMSAAVLPELALPGVQVIEAWPTALTWAGMALSLHTLDEPQRLRLRDALHGVLRDGTLRSLVRRHYGEPGLQRMRLATPEG